jgi:hypothetical protein
MQERLTPGAMRLRRSTVEHPFATIKGYGNDSGRNGPFG